MAQLNCIVVTPVRKEIEETADFIALPLQDGEMGIAAGRAPLVARLGCGELRLKQRGGVKKFYLEGGFAQVTGNLVSVLTTRVVPADKVDTQAAAEQLQEALQQPIT